MLNIKETDSKEISITIEDIAKELCKTYQETSLDPCYKRLPFLSTSERQQVKK